MGRSKRKHPFTGITMAASEKEWKREVNRQLRHASDQALKAGDPESDVLPVVNEIATLWEGPKDGKSRFDPIKYPKLMRK